MSGRWKSSRRKSALPPGWQKLRLQRRDIAGGRCEAQVHDERCDGFGSECHHAVHPDAPRLESLRWLNHYCHNTETQREAAAARASRSAKRPQRPHPGLL